MKSNTARLQSLPNSILPFLTNSRFVIPRHGRHISTHQIPSPTPFVPDSKTFLSLIGRNLSQHAAKIPTWESLFSLTSIQLRKLGVEPARTRRYLLWWRERFRKGEYGIGGDLKDIKDSVAHVRVIEVPRDQSSTTAVGPNGTRKIVVNVPPDTPYNDARLRDKKPINGLKVLGARTIAGPFVEPVKGTSGSIAQIRIQEGMWEQKRGHKVDGGERRKVQVRRKRKLEEMRKARA
ncbi:MAG: hypothetical protein Q9219_001230 [cf. Caloplaca sp. 3 TL-2023]